MVKALCSGCPGTSSKLYGPPGNVLVYCVGDEDVRALQNRAERLGHVHVTSAMARWTPQRCCMRHAAHSHLDAKRNADPRAFRVFRLAPSIECRSSRLSLRYRTTRQHYLDPRLPASKACVRLPHPGATGRVGS